MHEKKNKNQPAGDKQTRTLRAGRATDPFSSHTRMIDRSRSRVTPQAHEIERTRAKARAANARVARAAAARRGRVSAQRARLESKLVAADANRRAFRMTAKTKETFRTSSKTSSESIVDDSSSGPRTKTKTKTTACETRAAVKAQRVWRRFAAEKVTTSRLAKRFLATRPKAVSAASEVSSKNDDARETFDFDAFADAVRDEGVLRAARSFLARVAARLDASDRAARNLARRAGETKRESATFAAILSARQDSEDDEKVTVTRTQKGYAFPAKEVLCAYVVVSFPEVVLGAAGASELSGEHARALKASARETICALETLACAFAFTETDTCAPNASHVNGSLNHSLNDSSSSKRVLMRRFAEEWRLYAGALRRWKARDASVLERELIRAVCEMETSARRACGSSSRVEDFPEGSDARAILDALENDARVLRGKVRGLTGPEGVERFDRARRDARRDVARDEELIEDKNADATAPSVPGSETADPSSSTSSSAATRAARRVEAREAARAARLAAYAARRAASDANDEASERDARTRTSAEAYENEAIMHELLVDPEWRLPADDKTDPSTVSNEKETSNSDDLPSRVREAMTRAFWDATRDALIEKDIRRAAGTVAELGDALAALCPEHCRSEAEAALLLRLTPTAAAAALARVVDDPSALADAFEEVTREASKMLARLGAPARDEKVARDADALDRRVSALAEQASALFSSGDSCGASRVVADAVTHALRELFDALARIRRDVANVAVASLAPMARRDRDGKTEGSKWAWRRFAARRGVPETFEDDEGAAKALNAALPRTSAWLAAATRAAHRMDASIPARALEGVPRGPSARGADTDGSEGAPAPVAFAMRAGSAASAAAAAASADASRTFATTAAPPVSVRATRATSPEGLVRVALVELVTSEREATVSLPETLEFDAARLGDARRAFDALRVRAACLFVSAGAREGPEGPAARAERLRRLDALLADPTTSEDDLALEIAGDCENERLIRAESKPSAVAATLRRLLAPRDASGARLTRALAEALCVRALLGPPIAAASPVAAARAAAGAAPLLRAGFRGADGAAVARDVASLAARLDVSVGRVTWDVHARAYDVLARRALAAEDEI